MLVHEYRDFEQKAKSLYLDKYSPAKVDTMVIASRMKTNPIKLEKLPARDQTLVETWYAYVDEIQPVQINVQGKNPWTLRRSDCKDCVAICLCTENDNEVLCTLRDVLYGDLEHLTLDNQVEILSGEDTSEWDWAVYRTVDAVCNRIRSSPLSVWNSQMK